MMVSVILPNYNHAAYLGQRVDSILSQTHPQLELIILDDYSQDESRDVIEGYRGQPKISHIVYNEANSGSTFRQWKKGLELAKGDWIWIAESDDFCTPDFLETLLRHADGETGLVYANSYSADEAGQIIAEGLSHASWVSEQINKADFDTDFAVDGVEEFGRHLIYSNTIFNASAVLFRKELMMRHIDAAISMRLYGDWLLWSLIAVETRVAYVARPMNYFRCHTNNVRTRTRTRIQDMIREHNRFREGLEKLIPRLGLPAQQEQQLLAINKRQAGIEFKQLSLEHARHKPPFSTLQTILTHQPAALGDPRLLRQLGGIYYYKLIGRTP